jgi:hypothetical protein
MTDVTETVPMLTFRTEAEVTKTADAAKKPICKMVKDWKWRKANLQTYTRFYSQVNALMV